MASALLAYLDSVKARDPAPRSRWEILLYPGVWALFYHRIAHWLFQGELYFLARLVNHWSRMVTAIDIHPGAEIGAQLLHRSRLRGDRRDREIGDDVTIYQQVTLGGTNPTDGVGGKRHPTIEDGVIIGSGAQVLGPIIVGTRARIGANSVVTKRRAAGRDHGRHSGPLDPGRRGAEQRLGVPALRHACSETFDPATQKLEILQCEVEQLRARLAELLEERDRIEGRASTGRDVSNRGRA